MKKFLLVGTSPTFKKATLGLLFLLVATILWAQATGDYRSKATGNWRTSATWERYNGSGWVAATTYPGQNAGDGMVTIQNGHVVTIDGSISNPVGAVVIGTISGPFATLKFLNNGGASLSVLGSVSVNNGNFNVGNSPGNRIFNLEIDGNLAVAGLSQFNMISPDATDWVDVNFNGTTGNQNIAAGTFKNVLFSNTATKTATGALTILGNVTISSVSTFIAGSFTHTVGGDWIDNNSTTGGLNAGASTINFNGTGTQNITELVNGFYNLTTSNSGTRIFKTDLKIGNNLNVSGGTLDLGKQLVNNTSTSGTLSVADGATLRVGGLFPTNFGSYTFTNNSTVNYYASAPIVQSIAIANYGNLTLSGGGVKNLPFTGVGQPVNVNGAFLVTGAGTTVNTNSDINFNGSFTLDAGTTFNNSNYIYVKGNWVNNGTFNKGDRRVFFNGTTAQTISGTTATTFYDLIIDNNAGVTFTTNGTIDNSLTLTNGILSIQPANTLTLNNGALTIAGSPFSATKYIATLVDRASGAKGVLQVNGAKGSYTFPVGDAAYYLPAIVTPVDLNSTANYTITAFQGITKNGQPNGDPLENKSTVVDAIWDLNRTSASGSVTVKLGWPEILEGAGFATQDDPEQGIAIYTGTWNAFDGVPDGDLLTATRPAVITFGPFAVGIVGSQIILPVKFANVKAVQTGNGNLISWSNLTEEDVVSYEVERSSNGRSFTTIATLTPTRNNNGQADYSSLDNAPLNGTNFYRIKVTEGTGKVTYSIVMLLNSKASATAFTVVPNPVISSDATLQITNLPAGKYTVNVYGTSGQLISSQGIVHAGGSASQSLNMTNVKPGYYLIELKGTNVQFTQHVIKQ